MLAVLAIHPTSHFVMVVSEEMLHALGCQHYRAAFLASLPVLNFTQDKLVAKVTRCDRKCKPIGLGPFL